MVGLAGIILSSLAAAGLASAQNSTIRCAPGLQLFVSRGTDEPMGFGETGKLIEPILGAIEGSVADYTAYPASFGNETNGKPNNFVSVARGTLMLRRTILEYSEACPGSKMAVLGYSQGAQITSNNLCGSPPIWGLQGNTVSLDDIIEFSMPLPTKVTDNVVAVVLFGDPSHRGDAGYNHGDSTGSGVFWRSDISACEALGDRIRSYCGRGDPFCDVGLVLSPTVHLTYVLTYGKEVIDYIVGQYASSLGSQSPNSPGSAEPTPSPSPLPPASGAVGLPASLLAAASPFLAAMLI
jgi:acetylxylan esterase